MPRLAPGSRLEVPVSKARPAPDPASQPTSQFPLANHSPLPLKLSTGALGLRPQQQPQLICLVASSMVLQPLRLPVLLLLLPGTPPATS